MDERVLIVDDEKDFLDAMAERMENRGMKVTTCTSASNAVEQTEKVDYDAVVLDLLMPGMDGIQALKILKEKNPDLQVILLTGHATVEKGIEAMKLGALDLLEKPASIEELAEKISKARANKMILVEEHMKEKIHSILESKAW
jgi:DNA-binding NtrC family response regulator